MKNGDNGKHIQGNVLNYVKSKFFDVPLKMVFSMNLPIEKLG